VSVRFLLDTNVLSEPLKPSPNGGVLASLERHRDSLATAAPVWHELVFGLARLPASKKREVVREYLYEVVRASLDILPYDEAAADWHARERARLEGLGRPGAFVAGQIAAIAKTRGLVVVSRNASHYELFEGLRVENWFDLGRSRP
jgi:tRNA(fMet)-specific endonuclease VapC